MISSLRSRGRSAQSEEDALYRIYALLRPGDPPNIDTARNLIERMFFNSKRYNLGEVGRYRLGQRLRLGLGTEAEFRKAERWQFGSFGWARPGRQDSAPLSGGSLSDTGRLSSQARI